MNNNYHVTGMIEFLPGFRQEVSFPWMSKEQDEKTIEHLKAQGVTDLSIQEVAEVRAA